MDLDLDLFYFVYNTYDFMGRFLNYFKFKQIWDLKCLNIIKFITQINIYFLIIQICVYYLIRH